MVKNMIKKITSHKIEFITLLFILIFSFSICIFSNLYSSKSTEKFAIIEQNGTQIHKINLSDVKNPYDIEINDEFHVIIRVEPNKIYFKESTCPDKLCKKMGKISSPGQTAICLPAKISIRIVGQENEFDAISS